MNRVKFIVLGGMWLVALPALVALIAVGRVASHPNADAGPHTRDLGATTATTLPAFVETADGLGLVWQPTGGSPALAYSPLSGDAPTRALLPYPGLAPEAWHAVPALDDTFHLIWRNRDGSLHSALVDTAGQTRRGPIALSLPAYAEFSAFALPDGEALILAWKPGESQIAAVRVDATGRPRTLGSRTIGSLQVADAYLDTNDVLHLVWIAPPSDGTAALNVAAVALADFATETPLAVRQIAALPVAATDTIVSLAVDFDAAYGYVLTGIATAAQPDAEQMRLTSFPASDPAAAVTSALALPDAPAALRWGTFASGAGDTLYAALAARTSAGWQPALLTFDAGSVASTKLLDEASVDGGPTTAAIDSNGVPWLAWTTLDGIDPHLIVASEAVPPSNSTPDAGTTLLAGLAGFPLAILWLLAPVMIVTAWPSRPQAALWLAAGLYGAAKLLVPPALLAQGPWPAGSAGSLLAAATALMVIALIAALAYRATARTTLPSWGRWLVYGLTDALLTWLAFGTNAVPR